MDFTADLHMIPVLRDGKMPVESLNAFEKHLLGLVDGKRTVQELGLECGFDPELAGRIVGKFLMAGILDEATEESLVASESTPRPDATVTTVRNRSRDDETTQAITEAAIVAMYNRLEKSNHYELLGVSPIAERSEIRAAYFSLSKKFHPDTHFRHGTEELKKKLSRIFDRLTIAYETLSGKSRRHAYDASIASDIELWKIENSLKQSVDSTRQKQIEPSALSQPPAAAESHPEEPVRSHPPKRAPQSIQPKKPTTGSYRRTPIQDDVSIGARPRVSRIPATRSSYSAEAAHSIPPQRAPQPASANSATAEVQANRNASAKTSFRPSYDITETLSQEEKEARRRQWKKERLQKAIRPGGGEGRQSNGSIQTGTEVQLIEHARIAIEQQQFDVAIRCIQEVLRRDGENTQASELLRKAQSGKTKSDINEFVRRGRFEQTCGNNAAALEFYETAFKLDNGHLEARYHIAAILFEMRKDTRRAIQLCREIITMGGRKPQYFTTLADLYEFNGDRPRAIDSLQKAVELAPEDRDLKKRLKSMLRK